MSLPLSVSGPSPNTPSAGNGVVGSLRVPFFKLVLLLLGLDGRLAWAQADNDLFANREFLGGESFARVGSTLLATRDQDESATVGAGHDQASVWWSWQAPRDGTVRIHVERENHIWPLRWQVSRGESLSTLVPVAGFEQTLERGALFRARAGERYEVCAVAQADRPVFFTVHLEYVPEAHARQGLLEAEMVELTGVFTNATGLPELGASYTSRPALYWDWKVPTSGKVHFGLDPSSALVGLLIFEPRPDVGSGGFAALAESSGGQELTVEVKEGITYRLVLMSTGDLPVGEVVRAYATLSRMRFAGVGEGSPLPAGTVLSLLKTNVPAGVEFRSQKSFLTQPGSTLVLTNEPPLEVVTWQPTKGGTCTASFELLDTAGRSWSSSPILFVTEAPNDDFSNAQVLSGDALVVPVSAGGASLEAGEPPPAAGTTRSVWYRWTAPRDGAVDVELAATTGSLERAQVLEVFRGESLADLLALPVLHANLRSLSRQRVFAEVRAGDVLRIRVPPSATPGTRAQSLLVRFGDRLTHDDFAGRQEIIGTSFAGEYEALLATPQAGEIGPFDRVALRTAWYGWTAPSNGEVRIRTVSVDGSRVLPQFFLGDSLPGLKLLSGIEPNFGSPTVRDLTFAVDAGAPYALQIDSQSQTRFDTSSPARFTFEFFPPPANDEIANALPVSGDRWRVSGTLRGARGETNAPIGVRASTISPRRSGNRAVWYQWVAPRTGPFSLSVTATNNLNAFLFATNGFGPNSAPVAVATRSEVGNFVAASNRVYWVAAAMSDAAIGIDFELRLFPNLPPGNDEFVRATVLSGYSPSFEANFDRASGEPGDPLSRSLWWMWTAPVSGWARLNLPGSTRVAVTTRETLDPWVAVPVMEYGLAIPSAAVLGRFAGFDCEAGRTYRIGLDRLTGVGFNDFRLEVTTWRASEPAENQVFEHGDLVQLTFPSPDPAVDGVLRSPANLQWIPNPYLSGQTMASDADPARFEVHVTNSISHAVISATNHEGRLRFSRPLTLRGRPVNDDFAKATELDPTLAENLRVTVDHASREPGEPETSAGPEAGSRWWHWTPAYSGEVEWAPTLDPGCALTLYAGDAVSALQELGHADADDPLLDARVRQGVRYYVSLAGPRGCAAEIPLPQVIVARLATDPNPQLRYSGELEFPLRYVGDPAEFAEVQVLVDSRVVFVSRQAPFVVRIGFGVDRSGQPGARSVSARVVFRGQAMVQDTPAIPIRWRARNDLFENREPLTGNDLQWAVSYLNASREEWESGLGIPDTEQTLWWTWTAPEDGVVSVRSLEHRVMRLFEGDSPEMLRLLAMSPAALTTEVRKGQVLCLLAAGTELQLGDFIYWRFAPKTPQVDPILLTGSSAELRMTLSQLPQDPPVLLRREFRWTAPADGMLSLRTDQRYPTGIRVYDRTVDAGAELQFAFVQPESSSSWAGLGVGVRSGHEYAIVLESGNGVVPEYVGHLQWMPVLSVDAFAAAPSFSGTNFAVCTLLQTSTLEPGEPATRLPPVPVGTPGSTWVRWTAPSDGFVALEIAGAAAVFVTTGERVDDLQVLAGPFDQPFRFRAEAGRAYSIAFARVTFGSDLVLASLRLEDSPGSGSTRPHDLFEWRTPLTGTGLEVFGFGVNAGREYGEPLHAGIYGGRSVWWRWKAPRSGKVRLYSYASSDAAHQLAVYVGDELARLLPVARIVSEGLHEQTEFVAREGTDYAIALDGRNGNDPSAVVGLLMLENADLSARFVGVERLANRTLGVRIEVAASAAYRLQTSTDLLRWEEVGAGRLEVPAAVLELPVNSTNRVAFYRLRLGD